MPIPVLFVLVQSATRAIHGNCCDAQAIQSLLTSAIIPLSIAYIVSCQSLALVQRRRYRILAFVAAWGGVYGGIVFLAGETVI
ncbi:hypothetical protein [Primorskyibacter sp. S187A]|uniref:hypothetical protein n=1 Tax=Primorskyibacter sp. S187A TaxID=3415130 RepID=UPI003C7D1D86